MIIKTNRNQHYSDCGIEQKNYEGRFGLHSLKLVLKYIDLYLEQDLKLAELAQQINFSRSYLCYRFKQTTGISLHQYIIRQRVYRAKGLLESSSMSLSEIALCCGFYNHSHLTRAFKRLLGVSPSAFRVRMTNTIPAPEGDWSYTVDSTTIAF